MDKERMLAHQAKRKKAIKRLEAFKTHLEHTEDGRSRIAKIIGCDRSKVDEPLQLIKWKLKYVKLASIKKAKIEKRRSTIAQRRKD